MKIKDLIKKLEEHDPEMDVFMFHDEYGCYSSPDTGFETIYGSEKYKDSHVGSKRDNYDVEKEAFIFY